jgi:hypothetical protein
MDMQNLDEVLALPDLPNGYAELVALVQAGQLHDYAQLARLLETTWAGLEPWLAYHHVDFGERNAWPWPVA